MYYNVQSAATTSPFATSGEIVMKKISTQNSVVQLIEVYDMVDWKVPSGSLFLVQELLEGTDLDKWISKGGSPLSTFEALEVLIQVGAALHAMHERDLIHRDVKPSNVFLSNSPSGSLCVTLLDFGLAKQAVFEPDKADGEEGNSSKYFSKPKLSKLEPSRRIIKRASLVGTKNFAAPEVIECSKVFGTYDMTVDAFSLGKTLRFALTGGNTRVGRQILSNEPKVADNGEGDLLTRDAFQLPVHYCIEEPEAVQSPCSCLPFLAVSSAPRVNHTFVDFGHLPVDVQNTVLGLTHPNPDMRWSINEALSSRWAMSGKAAPKD